VQCDDEIEFNILAAMEENITLLPKQAWVTLVTKASYLPGAILLSCSFQKYNSKYSLIILTSHLPSSIITALKEECDNSNGYHFPINSLTPSPENTPTRLIASPFEDMWTKLRVFELYKYGCEKLGFLDADMLVRRNMDDLFSIDLPNNWIAANHVCCCNLDHDPWAPKDWNAQNCPYTGLLPDSEPAAVPNLLRLGMEQREHTHCLIAACLFFRHLNSNGIIS
jgi:hypothetical protein